MQRESSKNSIGGITFDDNEVCLKINDDDVSRAQSNNLQQQDDDNNVQENN
jgi:hypothetical protein